MTFCLFSSWLVPFARQETQSRHWCNFSYWICSQCQHCFSRSVAPTLDFTLFGSIVIRTSWSQKSHKVVLCSCNVGFRQAGIQCNRSEATQQPTDFLSVGQTEVSRCWLSWLVLSAAAFKHTGVGFSLLCLGETTPILININSTSLHPRRVTHILD